LSTSVFYYSNTILATKLRECADLLTVNKHGRDVGFVSFASRRAVKSGNETDYQTVNQRPAMKSLTKSIDDERENRNCLQVARRQICRPPQCRQHAW